VSTTFPRSGKKVLGYDTEQVEDFLAGARRAYDGEGDLTALSIRHTAFSMKKGGYTPELVDAALERLEDAFAAKERERAASTIGEAAWLDEARATAQIVINRLSREPRHRFARTSFLTVGYNKADVDRFANKLVKYFQDGFPITVDDVRTVVFRPARAGYRESQVDAVMDAVIDVMLAVR
jgi:DivIVA domain-containing protein